MPEVELTEMFDIDPARVDGVRTPASGLPILLMKAINAKGEVNEKPDIAGAETVLQKLAQLIIAEAEELAAGNWNELCDIELLTQAAYLMRCFRSGEEMGMEMSKAQLEAEVTKRAGELNLPSPFPEDASKDNDMPETPAVPEVTQTPAAVEPQAGKPAETVEKSLQELVKEEVAKAVEPLSERNKALEDEMAALKSLPIPGGPAITVPAAQRGSNEKAHQAAEAARFRRLAKSVNDQELVQFYEAKADEAEKASRA